MSRKPSKRKKPEKDVYQIKERQKTESLVFDKRALINLSKIMKKGFVQSVDYPISTGKEANVFRGTNSDGKFIAIKIYKIETAHFFRRSSYLEGDPRFSKIKQNEFDIVKTFAKKEYKNLIICNGAKVHAPRAYFLLDNILIMEFLGEGELPYPQLVQVGPKGVEDLESILMDLKKMYKAGLVHADVSEYNILQGDKPYFIDFGQGVVLQHPNSRKFLERDVAVILKYFGKYGIKKDFKKTVEWIMK